MKAETDRMMGSLKRSSVGLAAILTCAASGALAQGYGRYPSGHFVGETYGYGFAEPLVRGDYVGAPFTRFPSPSELVPSAWGYGTYGVPTTTGIRSAPVGIPTVYVIDGPAPSTRRPGARIVQRDGFDPQGRGATVQTHAGGARVIAVTLPRR